MYLINEGMSKCLLDFSCQDQFHDIRKYSKKQLSTRLILEAENALALTCPWHLAPWPASSRHLMDLMPQIKFIYLQD